MHVQNHSERQAVHQLGNRPESRREQAAEAERTKEVNQKRSETACQAAPALREQFLFELRALEQEIRHRLRGQRGAFLSGPRIPGRPSLGQVEQGRSGASYQGVESA